MMCERRGGVWVGVYGRVIMEAEGIVSRALSIGKL